jgi:hypothetical protein
MFCFAPSPESWECGLHRHYDLRVQTGLNAIPARHNLNPVPFEIWLREYVRKLTAFSYAKMIRQLSRLGVINNTRRDNFQRPTIFFECYEFLLLILNTQMLYFTGDIAGGKFR